MIYDQFLPTMQLHVTEALTARLPSANTRLLKAMHYATLQGGKRLRAVIMYAAAYALEISFAAVDTPACAIECIHAYSLIHDDLPAMDNDDFRRGVPSLHRAFDEATAILAGDALQSLAFEWLADEQYNPLSTDQRLDMITTLTKAIGYEGMAEGQMQDLLATNDCLSVEALCLMHGAKTGALLTAAVKLAYLSGNNVAEPEKKALTDYASALGLAFQIQDDILNVASQEDHHKGRQGSDEQNGKSTYVTCLGMAGAEAAKKEAFENVLKACEFFGNQKNIFLVSVAQYCVGRNY